MSAIFISYRRADAIQSARAVFERLRAEFGAEQVFIDLEGLAFGEDFVESLDRRLAECRVVLALMGPQWLDARDAKGRRRIDNGADFVRLELRTALARPGVKVVPLLIDGTDMPAEDDLPADLLPLLRRHAMALRFASFDADMRHMVVHLRRMLLATPGQTPVLATGQSPPSAGAWASNEGRDEYGRWAEFNVDGVVQRLRWIEPGEFLMGSPPNEPERHANEDPQHRVRLTHGFWLADTACTQALWLAVVGGANPAHFKDEAQNPVEQVSHDDAMRFLAALKLRLDGQPAVVLPTEAQWEYACRAGSTTPFSFGANITPEQVNYDGNYPYAGGAKGKYRERTVPVMALPANRWGLYQMHGNVWEWCADGPRSYANVPARQVAEVPVGAQGQRPLAHRAVRGGSWFIVARDARSAYRGAARCGDRDHALSFRLALRPSPV